MSDTQRDDKIKKGANIRSKMKIRSRFSRKGWFWYQATHNVYMLHDVLHVWLWPAEYWRRIKGFRGAWRGCSRLWAVLVFYTCRLYYWIKQIWLVLRYVLGLLNSQQCNGHTRHHISSNYLYICIYNIYICRTIIIYIINHIWICVKFAC